MNAIIIHLIGSDSLFVTFIDNNKNIDTTDLNNHVNLE